MIASAQVIDASGLTNDHGLSQDFTHPDDQTTLSKNVYVKKMWLECIKSLLLL